jgi:hypothetical protein
MRIFKYFGHENGNLNLGSGSGNKLGSTNSTDIKEIEVIGLKYLDVGCGERAKFRKMSRFLI